MNEIGEQIAIDSLAAIRRTIEFCQVCPNDSWHALTEEEGWPVAAVVRHIAEAGRVLVGFAKEMAAGKDVTMTIAEIDAWNAAGVAEWAATTRDEAIVALREVGESAATAVRSYTEHQLAGVHLFAIYGQPRSTKRMAEGFALHALEHLESARAAVGSVAVVQ